MGFKDDIKRASSVTELEALRKNALALTDMSSKTRRQVDREADKRLQQLTNPVMEAPKKKKKKKEKATT